VYYGYRAWGPNWPFSNSWTKGSSAGFISDVDAQGSRFNPNKLLIDPYAHEISQTRSTLLGLTARSMPLVPAYRNRDTGNHGA
jgi:isoamylase